MQIIFGNQVAEELKEKYTVLELEVIVTPKGILHPYCVVPMEKIALEMQDLEFNKSLHDKFITAIKENNSKLCQDLLPHLLGKFGGELDSFYEIVVNRCKETGSTKLSLENIAE